jgi:peptide/nickel transport system ATP-binding protein
MTGDADQPVLSVTDLRTYIHTDQGTIRAVDGVEFDVSRGETVCLVGESGSGKSVTCETVTGIVPQPPAEIVGGRVTFDGTDLLKADDSQLREIRGDRIAHVFQNPQHALDPVYTVGDQLVEAIELHREGSDGRPRERAIELLQRVGIPQATERVDDYPHEFSGGMRQRVAIAIALAAEPDLVIADEPTTAVDVTVQARLIELLAALTEDGTSILWVTHDLRVVSTVADRVLVMFGGTIVERGPVEAIFEQPAHPYTQSLFESFRGSVRQGPRSAREDVPTDGCRFRMECPHAVADCETDAQPAFHQVRGDDDHRTSCVYYGPDHDAAEILHDASGVPAKGERDE